MPDTFPEHWLTFDRDHLWHPYTSMVDPLPCYPVVAAEGVYLHLADGTTLIDGMSSWWCTLFGYRHPTLTRAATEQLSSMSHVMFGGITHPPAVTLGQRLIAMTAEPLQHLFLADSGSVAVEVAMKMALQYWFSQGLEHKRRFLTIRGGYHGDTLHCMSVCDPVNGMHHLFQSSLPKQLFANRPRSTFHGAWHDDDMIEIRDLLEQRHEEIAAVILEPIVQGAGGMYFYHPEYLNQLRRLCDHHDVLLIFDEIATGFGRTGKMFATDHTRITPDILCLGKALTGGMMTLGATLTTRRVAMGISQGQAPQLMHGPTFMANPLACAVAGATLDLLNEFPWQTRVREIAEGLQRGLAPLINHSRVTDIRVLGAIGVVEMDQPVNMAKIQKAFVAQGVWIRPFGRLIYSMPPYIITDEQLQTLCTALVRVVSDNT